MHYRFQREAADGSGTTTVLIVNLLLCSICRWKEMSSMCVGLYLEVSRLLETVSQVVDGCTFPVLKLLCCDLLICFFHCSMCVCYSIISSHFSAICLTILVYSILLAAYPGYRVCFLNVYIHTHTEHKIYTTYNVKKHGHGGGLFESVWVWWWLCFPLQFSKLYPFYFLLCVHCSWKTVQISLLSFWCPKTLSLSGFPVTGNY